MPSVQAVFPIGTSEKTQMRFMNYLIQKGLVEGCVCGCRGDYEINQNGLEFLAQDSLNGLREVERYHKDKGTKLK